MLFDSFFRSLIGKDVVLELKNDLNIAGTLHSVDQYLNFKLTDITVLDAHVSMTGRPIPALIDPYSSPQKFPYMLSVKNCFVRGSVVRYVQLPVDDIDVTLLQDATRKAASKEPSK